ncbi:Na+/H+ antiporter [Fodinicola feengrottensis]|uniref:Na+/H+ antiporter n=1 Tax=Fodinicola feengrottensis TaxID=435914 RepID=A0ABN2H0W3_9ACTN|nr:Na+/H+ antiporter [Fodinicola feengrottensis]
MHGTFTLFGLVVGAVLVAGAARKLKLSAPILLVLVGLAAAFVPGLPDYSLTRLDPEVFLFLVLPPLLYSEAVDSSYMGFRRNMRAIGLLSVGLVLMTTIVVGVVMHMAVGLSIAAAFMLGALVAPPDAVAAMSIGRTLGLPRQMLTVLGGESLLNDATALTAYRVALAAVLGGGVSLLEGATGFLIAAAGGVIVGLIAGPILHWVRMRLADPVLENVLALLIPFVVYALAESLHLGSYAASGVLAVVVVGLYLGHRNSQTTYAARLIAGGVWKMVKFFLESIVFALIGLQLPSVLAGQTGKSATVLIISGVGIVLLVIVIRFVWVFPASYLPRILVRRIREDNPNYSWRNPTIVSWSGMRGVVSLAAAFAIPTNVPGRGTILFLVFCVVLGTLVVQGLTLPSLIRRIGISTNDTFSDNLAEANAQHAAIRAAVDRLDTVLESEDIEPPDGVADRLRAWADSRQLGAWERLGSGPGRDAKETPSAAFRRLRREMLTAERDVFVSMRDSGSIDDEVLRRVFHELDLEEAMLARE